MTDLATRCHLHQKKKVLGAGWPQRLWVLESSGEQQGCPMWWDRKDVWGQGTVCLGYGWCGLGRSATLLLALLSSVVHETF